jgi:hypothetical protein
MGYLTRDAVFSDKVNYSTSDKLLFDIRRYARVVVAMQVVFVSIVALTFGLVWNRVSKYELVKPGNINTINEYVVATLSNAQAMTTLAVPIVANLQYASDGLVAAVEALYNASAVYNALGEKVAGRKLAQASEATVTPQALMYEDYQLRHMVYEQVHALLESSNVQLRTFDMAAVNLILLSAAEQIQALNFTGLAERYDRTMADLESMSHFGVLASAMLGAAASVTNISSPGLAQAMGAYAG